MPLDRRISRTARAARWTAAAGRAAPRAVAIVGAALLVAGCAGSAAPPDVVLIVVDTLRRDYLSPYGADVHTPHIAALAERGTAIDELASYHQTTMSMGALFTGRTPSIASGDPGVAVEWRPSTWCGMGRFQEGPSTDRCLPESVRTLGEAVRSRGYTTVGVVANALLFRPAGFDRGFDRWVEVGEIDRSEPEEAARGRTWQHVNEGVRRALADRPEGPLFLYVHYLDVHDYNLLGLGYGEAVERMDEGIGDLLALLGERGVLPGAVVVFTSDHGQRLGEHNVLPGFPSHAGNPSFHTLLDVPLIVTGADLPALPPLVRTEDVHRLLLRLVGVAEDQMPAGDLAPDELFLTERLYRTYQRGRFKSFWNRRGEFTLVDLGTDPDETRDVAGDHPDVATAQRARMDELTRALAAPDLQLDAVPEKFMSRLRALGYVE